MKNFKPLTCGEMKDIVGGVEDDIRKYRAEKCYNQDFMASQLGISQSMYFKIESGLVKITMERLKRIAEILEKILKTPFNCIKKTKILFYANSQPFLRIGEYFKKT